MITLVSVVPALGGSGVVTVRFCLLGGSVGTEVENLSGRVGTEEGEENASGKTMFGEGVEVIGDGKTMGAKLDGNSLNE